MKSDSELSTMEAATQQHVSLADVQHHALESFRRLLEIRNGEEQSQSDAFSTATRLAEREARKAREKAESEFNAERSTVEDEWQSKLDGIQSEATKQQNERDARKNDRLEQLGQEFEQQDKQLRTAYQDNLWTNESLFEANQRGAEEGLQQMKHRIKVMRETVAKHHNRLEESLLNVGVDANRLQPSPEIVPEEDPFKATEELKQSLDDLETDKWVHAGSGVIFFILIGFLFLLGIVLIATVKPVWVGALAALLFLVGGGLLGRVLLAAFGRARAARLGIQLLTKEAATNQGFDLAGTRAETKCQTDLKEAADRRARENTQAQDHYEPRIAKLASWRDEEEFKILDKHTKSTKKIQEWEFASRQQTDLHYQRVFDECNQRWNKLLKEIEDLRAERVGQAQWQRTEAFAKTIANWKAGIASFRSDCDQLAALRDKHYLPWSDDHWNKPDRIMEAPAGLKFGSVKLDYPEIGSSIRADSDWQKLESDYGTLPAYLPFPRESRMLLKATDPVGRSKAIQFFTSVMLRFLTAVPPAKVRFTIIDPVGLGENFASFMHLADLDAQLVTNRIWTETSHIEQRLSDLTGHMENVIQKFLRNQFRTIEEYNRMAGEVAEPFRVLVVADFPVNFNLEASRKLVSIISSGSACGVYAFVLVDPRQPMPHGFSLNELEQAGALVMNWTGTQFLQLGGEFAGLPMQLEMPPENERITSLIKWYAETSQDAGRVEVPFKFVAPPSDAIWMGSTRKLLNVGIGRAGATKIQMLQLGIGTAQHALVAGKTGSGKSTLLHALITNLALTYSPDEIELYLIDFKKGVEFKAYAEAQLPHARVIAIESEREFGLSVLQRLDQELKNRGDRFRHAGVNDLNGFRAVMPEGERCPRILLVVDEFQEFFTEDDKLAQECGLLMDRLVRQGRAFGVHLLLGSQTLGGAYSLARATIDQMAVRIALQCSESDAQLILSKDNMAARLLSRPGEAIYNDANGLVEGNDLFQVVYLPETERERNLTLVREKAANRWPAPLVFEGNIPAVLTTNVTLEQNMAHLPTEKPRAAFFPLGDAVAIKDPTAAIFRPQSASHLLTIGQQEELALGILAAGMLTLGYQYPAGQARFFILDGTNEEDPNWGYLKRIGDLSPTKPRMVERFELPAVFAELDQELKKRIVGEVDKVPTFIFVHGLHRYRDLRKADDDFSFGRGGDKPATPASAFANILKEGPLYSMHLILWSDSLQNVNRSIDRPMMREVGQRILFQMSPADSSTLIDIPAAAKLGRNRALYVTEETPNPEKFRPYGILDADGIAELQRRIQPS
jgi:DNA segregation ATPase FtsK/SpoIIIE, S-DNA-T family